MNSTVLFHTYKFNQRRWGFRHQRIHRSKPLFSAGKPHVCWRTRFRSLMDLGSNPKSDLSENWEVKLEVRRLIPPQTARTAKLYVFTVCCFSLFDFCSPFFTVKETCSLCFCCWFRYGTDLLRFPGFVLLGGYLIGSWMLGWMWGDSEVPEPGESIHEQNPRVACW